MTLYDKILLVFLLCIVVFAMLLGSTKPGKYSAAGKICEIPEGAIKIFLPDVQQPDEYSCGPAVTMSAAAYYGSGPQTLKDFNIALGTTEADGTHHPSMVAYLNKLGLRANVEYGMSKYRLKQLIDDKIPVIILIQAYAKDVKAYDDVHANGDGHFAIPIGYDENHCYFMDPALSGRHGFLTWDEFLKRWRADIGGGPDGRSENIVRYGIVVKPPSGKKPVYSTRAQRID